MRFTAVFAILSLASSSWATETEQKVAKFIPDQYIITFSADISRDPTLEREHYEWLEHQLSRVNSRAAGREYGVLHKYRIGPHYKGYAAKVPQRLAELIEEMPNVAYMEQDEEVSIVTVQNRPVPWGLTRISQRELAVQTNYTYPDSAGEGVTAYVIDTYVCCRSVF